MRRRWTVLLLLGAALASLTSLYLPWQKASGQQGGTVSDVLGFFAENRSVDGWTSGIGDVAAVSALLLAVVAAVALYRPNLADRLPLGVSAGFVGYFTVAVAAQARSVAQQREAGAPAVDFHYAYGAYIGLAAAIVVVVAAAAMRRDEIALYRSLSWLVMPVLVLSLLIALLLPWGQFAWPVRFTFLGITYPAVVLAAAFALCLPLVWWRAPVARRLLAVGTALFTAAAVSSFVFPGSRAYGASIGVGVATVLAALGLIDGARVSRPRRPPWLAIATGVVVALFVSALFLPWQTVCYPAGSDFGPYSGRCISGNAWTTIEGSAAAVLALALLVVTLAPQRFVVSIPGLAAGVGILVATLGFHVAGASGSGTRSEFGYGSIIGFIAAALLVAVGAFRLRPRALEWSRVPARLLPLAACAAYLVVVVVPWWDVLPERLQSNFRFAPLSWLTIAGMLLGIHLVRLWTQQIAGRSWNAGLLVLLPLVLLALAAVDLIQAHGTGVTWGGGAVVALCLLLALLGRVEQHEGLENVRIPEMLRVDRL
jgi:hypothetical protein